MRDRPLQSISQKTTIQRCEKISLPDEFTQEQVVGDLLHFPDKNAFGFFIECD